MTGERVDSGEVSLEGCDVPRALSALAMLQREAPSSSSMVLMLKYTVQHPPMTVSRHLYRRHAKWCHTGGAYIAGVEPARAAAIAMYGQVPPKPR